MTSQLDQDAVEYHRAEPAGKLAVVATKPLANQRDLSLAYSPGVAAACNLIRDDPAAAAEMTARGNLVAVVTNGTAVLGLGDIGPLASKPVMEGKAVLFKKFAGIDSFDIEVDEKDPEKLVQIVKALEPSFGAINLEDIKAPDCFYVERELQERTRIPVFHDDQHGTAIIVAAALTNALHLVGKRIEEVKLVASGAGAAALACLNLLVSMGLKKGNVTVCDIEGVVYAGRASGMDKWKGAYARETEWRTLSDAIGGADVFMGLSAPNVLKPEMIERMADRPVIMALANPTPEIDPDLAKKVRPDAIVATGRSDHPNQVNNVLCFPYIFRGALDVGATTVNEAMKQACVDAIAKLARTPVPETVAAVYGVADFRFGPDYLIPKPFDPRLMAEVSTAVARAAMETGVAERPIQDLRGYHETLSRRVFRSGFLMKPVFERAAANPQRLVYGDGEEEVVLRAIQVVLDEGLARPIVIGRPEIIERRIERLGLRMRLGEDVEVVDEDNDPRYNEYVELYRQRMGRRGVTPDVAREVVRTRRTVIGALMVARGEADVLLAGPVGSFERHLLHINDVLGMRAGMREASTLHALVLDSGPLFLTDTYVTYEPTPEEITATALRSAEVVRGFGITPKLALLSHSSFGSHATPSSLRMRQALTMIREADPELEVDGEMHADAALDQAIRERLLPESTLSGEANLLLMPNLDAANIAYNLVKAVTGVVSVGPILLGPSRPAHVLTSSVSARGVVNMTALACVDAQGRPQA